jgi:N-acetyl-gamma-glutamyl-phosphate reductase
MYIYATSYSVHTPTVISACIVGASGYSGAELLRLLSTRDDVLIRKAIAGSSAGKRVDELYPAYAGRIDGVFESLNIDDLGGVDIAFVALPSGESMKVVPALMYRVGKVIDLSGDFRLTERSVYEEYYRHSHTAFDLVDRAVYGLPEINRKNVESAGLVANPGCYATSIVLALLPVLGESIIEPDRITVTSMSGVSGAGRASSVELSFAEVNENIRAYKVPGHQHIPEVESVLKRATGKDVRIAFIPHLVPVTRGIYTTITARLRRSISDKEIADCFTSFYSRAPFVRYRRTIPQLTDVVRTNFCDIGCIVDNRANSIVIISVLDNLLKGAAGQAVQNMNIMCGLPETRGLI